ncbi:amphi-Trp domain-containing protein [Desulfovibrio ferrophilus]|uniref:Amphi-Trp domain-containing protein n=1 Tax=Desulfovibrio ferrophilus TaxID=241368 RepID=A0A2Z6AV16_9BACT|nr:amphi-Trp domain-containing protein [Desulfovibrio ferrophilus]BBD07077.1 uncharacterized protein DFE_0351 [Desulfovibrio ferrophilus]
MGKDKISLKAVQGRAQAAEYLEEFAKSLRAGKILIEQDEDSLMLCPPDVVDLEVQAKSKKGSQKFSLEVVWSTDQEQQAIRILPVDDDAMPVKSESTIPAKKTTSKPSGKTKN